MTQLSGLLLVDKPVGWTSFDVVNKIRSIIQQAGLHTSAKKRFPVGHAGTLDPLASGLLIILLGDYTKKAEQLTKLDKVYAVTAHLGQTSTTGDEEGDKTTISSVQPSITSIQASLEQWTGQVSQVPPVHSAIKINGRRAYQLARAGKTPQIKARTVTIYGYQHLEYQYPSLSFQVTVSSGTYIRSLVQDIGESLKTGAYTSQLRRLSIDRYQVSDAVLATKLSPEIIQQHLQVMA